MKKKKKKIFFIFIIKFLSLVVVIVDVLVLHLLLHFNKMKCLNISMNIYLNFFSYLFLFFLSHSHFEEFFCTHAPLIESHFQKIMTAAEVNINERNSIAAALLDVWKNFNQKNFDNFGSFFFRNYSILKMIFIHYIHVLVFNSRHGIF